MIKTAFVGVDPGESGAIAIQYDGTIKLFAFHGATPKDISDFIAGEYLNQENMFCMIEKVHAMPKQGVASSCKFCRNAGLLEGIIVTLGIPHEFVPPGTWQRSLGCLSGGDKNITKTKAQQLFPGIKITHKVADALLISEYAKRKRESYILTTDN